MGEDFSEFKNRWFSFDWSGADSELLNDGISGLPIPPLPEISVENTAQIQSILENSSLVKILAKEKGESVSGVSTDKYIFDLDKEGIVSFVSSVDSIMIPADTATEFSSLDIDALNSFLNGITNFRGEVYIGQSDKLPYKIDMNFTANMGEFGSMDVSFVSSYSDWGIPVTIVKPEMSQNIFQFLTDSINDARSKGSDAAIKANLSNIRVQAEIVYDMSSPNSYASVCDDSLVIASLSAATSASGTSASCLDSRNAWRASSVLKNPASPTTYWCVDSTGSSKAVTKLPTGLSCN